MDLLINMALVLGGLLIVSFILAFPFYFIVRRHKRIGLIILWTFLALWIIGFLCFSISGRTGPIEMTVIDQTNNEPLANVVVMVSWNRVYFEKSQFPEFDDTTECFLTDSKGRAVIPSKTIFKVFLFAGRFRNQDLFIGHPDFKSERVNVEPQHGIFLEKKDITIKMCRLGDYLKNPESEIIHQNWEEELFSIRTLCVYEIKGIKVNEDAVFEHWLNRIQADCPSKHRALMRVQLERTRKWFQISPRYPRSHILNMRGN